MVGEGQDSGPFSVRRDIATGIVHVTGNGFWTMADIDRHFEKLGNSVRSARTAGARVMALVDLRGAVTQSPELVSHLADRAGAVYTEGDRIAIVVHSNLAKMQMRRVVQSAEFEMFLMPDAAEAWLMQDRPAEAGRPG
ncbi:hypothetical protein KFK14_17130 [Sphingobium phenoxybenzoativorans]|uniref:STAS/SEC14 domain-containing protein n=1 Tax=Sphingobium phenoxybenzoativorans TaxID=1592790 RepID=A0A975K4M5_9SPHN|nr:hypothetical protein [Sphingobium phenoxybenzoativorans]QUT04745.1 hypothetical protein KFK14_17130 [Sphingobium phenoxybenzoativorans]